MGDGRGEKSLVAEEPAPVARILIDHGPGNPTDAMTNRTATTDSSFRSDRHPDADAQGQAALLLIESLIHSLLDNGALTKPQALEAIESAMQVKRESAAEEKGSSRTLRRSLALLEGMQQSLKAHTGRHDPDAQAGPDADDAN